MRFTILFALCIAAYAHANTLQISEDPAVGLAEPKPIEDQQIAASNVPNSLLDVVDIGGGQGENAERTARSYGWGGYGGYKRWGGYGGYGRGYGGYGRGYGGYGRGYGGYGGYGYGYRKHWG